MSEEVYYYSKSKNEEIPVSEMSDLYVRRAFKKMILKEKKKFDEKEKIKVFVRNAMSNLERALEETIIEGPKTTVPFHQAIMKDQRFRSGDFDTNFLNNFKYNDGEK